MKIMSMKIFCYVTIISFSITLIYAAVPSDYSTDESIETMTETTAEDGSVYSSDESTEETVSVSDESTEESSEMTTAASDEYTDESSEMTTADESTDESSEMTTADESTDESSEMTTADESTDESTEMTTAASDEPTDESTETTTETTTEDDMDLTDLSNSVKTIPVVGSLLGAIINALANLLSSLDRLTNGVFSRFLGGSLPCKIDVDEGITCSGTSVKGGVYGLLEEMIKGLPDTFVPHFLKMALLNIIDITINPIADTLFGGVPKEN